MPVVDNLYLDMNGIIHNCTHGNDPGTRLTEPEMIVKVFAYLEKLFEIVQPQQLLFMAVDGAPPSPARRASFAGSAEGHAARQQTARRRCGGPVLRRGAARQDEPAAVAALQVRAGG